MNLKPYLFLFLLVFFASCKKDVSATIKLKIELENKFNSEYPDLYQLKVFKNGKLFKKYVATEMPYIEQDITLTKLPKAKYQFEYYNFFNQKVIKSLIINESKIYNIKIYPDFSNYKANLQKSIIGKLSNDDTLKLNYKTVGCFHSDSDSLVINKKNNKYFLTVANKTTKLNINDVEFLKKIECELYELPKLGGCTTSDYYTLHFKNNKTIFIDATCKWNAWASIYEKFVWKEKQ